MRSPAVALALTLVAGPLMAQSAAPAGMTMTSIDAVTLRELEAIRDTAWRAWFSSDQAIMQRILPSNFIGIGWGGDPWEDKAGTMRSSADFVAAGGKLVSLAFPTTEVHLFGDVAVVYSNYDVSFEVGGNPVRQAGRSTEVFVRQKGGWWLHPSWHLDSGK